MPTSYIGQGTDGDLFYFGLIEAAAYGLIYSLPSVAWSKTLALLAASIKRASRYLSGYAPIHSESHFVVLFELLLRCLFT